jgi:hypothetical protein
MKNVEKFIKFSFFDKKQQHHQHIRVMVHFGEVVAWSPQYILVSLCHIFPYPVLPFSPVFEQTPADNKFSNTI